MFKKIKYKLIFKKYTKNEIISIFKSLFEKNFEFKLNYYKLYTKWDFYFDKYKKLIENNNVILFRLSLYVNQFIKNMFLFYYFSYLNNFDDVTDPSDNDDVTEDPSDDDDFTEDPSDDDDFTEDLSDDDDFTEDPSDDDDFTENPSDEEDEEEKKRKIKEEKKKEEIALELSFRDYLTIPIGEQLSKVYSENDGSRKEDIIRIYCDIMDKIYVFFEDRIKEINESTEDESTEDESTENEITEDESYDEEEEEKKKEKRKNNLLNYYTCKLNEENIRKYSKNIFVLNNIFFEYSDKVVLTILMCAKKNNINIPYFCYHPLLSIAGNCRMCLVEVKGNIKPVISCATTIMRKMVIYTNNYFVKLLRENILEFLLINHPLDCPICDQAGECDLQDQTIIYGGVKSRFIEKKKTVTDKYFNSLIKTTMTRCINCTRCIRFADEIAGVNFLGTMGKGIDMEIGTYVDVNFKSEISSNIIDICPVGALNNKISSFEFRNWELKNNETIDLVDSLNININIQTNQNKIARVLPSLDNDFNLQLITDKTRFFFLEMQKNRILFPMFKVNNTFKYSSWNMVISSFLNLIYNYKKEIKMININNYLDYIDLENIKDFSIKNKLFITSNFKNSLNNNRNNWLLNININNLKKIKNIFFLYINLKKINSLLNIKIYKNLIKKIYDKIYSIGIYFNNIYKIKHLFVGLKYLNNFYLNKNYLSNIFLNNKFEFLYSNENKYYYKYYLFKKKIINYNNIKHGFNYISKNSTEIMINDLSLNIYKLKKKYIFLIYNISTFENIFYNKYFFNVVNQISNYKKNKNKSNMCLYFPIKNIYENEGIFYNLFYKKKINNISLLSTNYTINNNIIFDLYNKFVKLKKNI